MSDYSGQITTPAQPNLGNPSEVYDRLFFSQTLSNIGNYASRVTNALGALFGPRGGKYINAPYGAFHDSTDQVAASTTAATAITFDTTDFSNGVTLSNSSRFNVSQSGIYNVQFSIQLKNTTNDSHDVDIWFRKNGTNIDNSNSRYHPPARKSTGDPSHMIAALNLFAELNSGDYVEIMFKVDNVNVTLEHFAASASPTRPAVPSAIVTLSFVSNLSV
jgi:hypothetical protein